jgi:hypothetical protein
VRVLPSSIKVRLIHLENWRVSRNLLNLRCRYRPFILIKTFDSYFFMTGICLKHFFNFRPSSVVTYIILTDIIFCGQTKLTWYANFIVR